jgi:uncharacterized protein (TIGR00297 family)
VIARAALGLAAAAVIAEAGRRSGGLTTRGAVAAVVTGTITMAAGLRWGAVLVGFFIAGTLLSRLGASIKATRTAAVVSKSGARDAWQVAANGGVFAAAAIAWAVLGAPELAAAALGALSGAFGDTAATEIGTWLGGTPRSILTGLPMAPGLSGGITLLGSIASVAAVAGFAWAGAWLLAMPQLAAPACVGGVGGAFADSLYGATLQERRWCEACQHLTEQRRHHCGAATRPHAGLAGFDNDAVNAAATLTAALLSALALGLWGAV